MQRGGVGTCARTTACACAVAQHTAACEADMPRMNALVPAEPVLEVVTPRTNTARLSSAEHLFGRLVLAAGPDSGPVSLEIAGDADQRRFLVRTTSPAELRRVSGNLGAAYPQAALRPFNSATFPNGDPAQLGPDEQLAAITLRLRAGEHLPLRTFEDRELDTAGSSVQVDPLLGVLGALGDLPKGWRALVQLVVLSRAPADWAHGYLRLTLERPLEAERRADTGPSLGGPLFILGLIGLYLVGSSTLAAWSRGDWLEALEWVAGSLAAIAFGIVVTLWLRRREVVDPRLVQAKL